MDNPFELLEEKVRKAAELVRALRKENKSLEQELVKARGRLHEAEKRLDASEREAKGAGGSTRELETLQRELKGLLQERAEVRDRIAKLVEVLDSLD
jgi:predicted  nucleic acid-binding Zn-ribbon protein